MSYDIMIHICVHFCDYEKSWVINPLRTATQQPDCNVHIVSIEGPESHQISWTHSMRAFVKRRKMRKGKRGMQVQWGTSVVSSIAKGREGGCKCPSRDEDGLGSVYMKWGGDVARLTTVCIPCRKVRETRSNIQNENNKVLAGLQ